MKSQTSEVPTLDFKHCGVTGWTILVYPDGTEYGKYTTKSKAVAAKRGYDLKNGLIDG